MPPVTIDGAAGISAPAINAGNIVGEVAFFAMTTPPTGWLKCDGTAVSRTTYAALFTALGTTYGAGNGSTTFNLPDLRGEFIRGLDDGRGVDTSRGIGTAQAGEVGNHGHPYRLSAASSGSSDASTATTGGFPMRTVTVANRAAFTGTPSNTAGEQIGGNGGVETRPRNVALLACIKF